jgi:hypothetical protein
LVGIKRTVCLSRAGDFSPIRGTDLGFAKRCTGCRNETSDELFLMNKVNGQWKTFMIDGG